MATIFENYKNKTGLSVFDSENQTILKELVHREVIQNINPLIQHFLEYPGALDGSGYDYEDILNIVSGIDYKEAAADTIDDWAIDELCEYLEKHQPVPEHILDHVMGLVEEYWNEEQVRTHIYELLDTRAQDREGEVPDPDLFDDLRSNMSWSFSEVSEVVAFLDWKLTGEDSKNIFNLEQILRNYALSTLNDAEKAEEFCHKYDVEVDNYHTEALEFWNVTEWFARKLKQKGELVGELFNLDIWGRGSSGQAILLDHVVAEIALDMEILVGQDNDWSKSGIV
jgi:hypothetical protein